MFFLLRTAFWLSLLLWLLPLGASEEDPPAIAPAAAIAATFSALDDLGGFCERRPAACETGAAVVAALRERARLAARTVLDVLDEGREAPQPAVSVRAESRPVGVLPAKPAALAEPKRGSDRRDPRSPG